MENYDVYINKYRSIDEVKAAVDSGELKKPYVAMIEGTSGNIIDFNTVEPTDWSKDYLQFEVTALPQGTLLIQNTGHNNWPVSYKVDDGEWFNGSQYTDFSSAVTVGSVIRVKANSWNRNQYDEPSGLGQGGTLKIHYGTVKVKGNVLSLCLGDNFLSGQIPSGQNFNMLFMGSNTILSARDLYLPTAVAMNNYGYAGLFNVCSLLAEAPKLDATAVGYAAYVGMFYGCTSLTEAPELPATTLGEDAYTNMFATCTSLTEAPELPASNLGTNCYQLMFQNCTNLSYVRCLIQSGMENCQGWLSNVAADGVFVKKAGTTWSSGADGIPEGWTVEEE